jgi:DNA-directed RNA polymerase beta subunit
LIKKDFLRSNMDTKIISSFHRLDFNTHINESMENTYSHSIPVTVALYGSVSTVLDEYRYTYSITDVQIQNSPVGITECFQFGHSYIAIVMGTIQLHRSHIEKTEKCLVSSVRTKICSIPLFTGNTSLSHPMLAEDITFHSGIVIINGKPRTIPPVKTLRYDYPLRFVHKETFSVQIRSSHPTKPHRSTSTIEIVTDRHCKRAHRTGLISVSLPFVTQTIPLSVIMLAFGIESLEAIVALLKTVAGDRYDVSIFRAYEINLLYTEKTLTQDEATLKISQLFGKQILSTGLNIVKHEIFPHLNSAEDECATVTRRWPTKILYMAVQTVSLILLRHGRITATDRDAYIHAQMITAGTLLGQLFRLFFLPHMRTIGKLLRRTLTSRAKKQRVYKTRSDARNKDLKAVEALLEDPSHAQVDYIDLVKLFGQSRLSARILSSVAKGTWSAKRKGITISLNTNNEDAIECQLRRASSSLTSTDGSHTGPRSVQMDQYGYVCPASTPGGESVGLVYNLAQFASITTTRPTPAFFSAHILDTLLDLSQYRVQEENIPTRAVFVTDHLGQITHMLQDEAHARIVIQDFLELRRNGHISVHMFISYDRETRDLRLLYQEGLLMRALAVVSRLDRIRSVHNTFSQLLHLGVIEYTTPAEETSLFRVAARVEDITDEATHVELSESSFLEVLAACVPHVTSQQGPRLSYYTSQVKQFIVPKNDIHRMGSMTKTQLMSTHRDLSTTSVARMLPRQTASRGVPLVVAFICLPDAQEDAIVLKKSSVERGALHCSTSRTYMSDALNPTNSLAERFEVSDVALARRNADYSALTSNGLPAVRSRISPGGIVIGKTKSVKTDTIHGPQVTKRDISTFAKKDEGGSVVESSLVHTPMGKRAVVIVETYRTPDVGDKLSTRYSQKGVIGNIVPDEDMPFSQDTGVAPDIIVSPLSMTSRMTMGALLECLTGKTVAVTGERSHGIDKQHFADGIDFQELGTHLQKNGFHYDGTEMYIDGKSGQPIKARVFTGIITYFRLVHLSARKQHVRSTGPRDVLTRQPRDGRKFGGGLKTGEMECAALASHGAAAILQSRVCTFSDAYTVYVCGQCDTLCDGNIATGYYWCGCCESNELVRRVRIPYALLVMMYELIATGIDVRLIIRKNDAEEIENLDEVIRVLSDE